MSVRCSKCGLKYSADGKKPCDCKAEPVMTNPYKVPLRIITTDVIVYVDVTKVDEFIKNGTHELVGTSLETPNVLINGELNNVAIGKKIKEKNEQLKKKHAGYEHEQKNLKKHIEKQIEQKHRKEGLI